MGIGSALSTTKYRIQGRIHAMIQINKMEALALREHDGLVKITTTSRNKNGNRKHYFVEESFAIKKFLTNFRKKEYKILYSKGVNKI